MPDETLKVRKLAVFDFKQRAFAFGTSDRDLIAGRFACRTIDRCFILNTGSSISRFGNVSSLAVDQFNENVSDLPNRQTKIDINHVQCVLWHTWFESFGGILHNRDAASRFDRVQTSRAIIAPTA